MSENQSHIRPLSPASVLPVSDETTDHSKNKIRRKNRIKCVTCVSITLLILIAIVLTLVFTVFKVKDPIISMNNVSIGGLDSTTSTTQIPRSGLNITMIVDVSVKNPNSASFKYGNTTTDISLSGVVIGEARGPPGKAKPRRTARMNMTVEIMMDRVLLNPGLGQEIFGSGLVHMMSYTKVSGKVKILGILKKHVTVKMNCTMAVNITRQAIDDVKCKKKINL